MSQSTFHLKGTGWYVTDYASKRNVSEEKKEKPAKQNEKKAVKAKGPSEKPKKKASSPKAEKD